MNVLANIFLITIPGYELHIGIGQGTIAAGLMSAANTVGIGGAVVGTLQSIGATGAIGAAGTAAAAVAGGIAGKKMSEGACDTPKSNGEC